MFIGLLMLALVAGASIAANAPASYKQGANYIPVVPAQPTLANPGQVEVLEFFGFGNPQCFALEPYLASWTKDKPGNVIFERVPVSLNPQDDVAARAYYTALQLNISDKANAAIYASIHISHHELMIAGDYQKLFTSQLGVDAKLFASTWNSPAVNALLAQARVLVQRYGVNKVPVFAVNGKWLTGAGFRLSDAQIMGAVNWLVQREQALQPTGTQ